MTSSNITSFVIVIVIVVVVVVVVRDCSESFKYLSMVSSSVLFVPINSSFYKRERERERERERGRRESSDVVIAFVEDVDETGGEDAAALRIAFDVAFHPVVVFRFLHHDDEDLALAERHFVVVVRLAVVQRTASSTYFIQIHSL